MIEMEDIPITKEEYTTMVKTINQLRKEKQHLIEKTCEWLETHAADYEQSAGTCDSWYSTSELVDAFRKHMEEQ